MYAERLNVVYGRAGRGEVYAYPFPLALKWGYRTLAGRRSGQLARVAMTAA